MKLLKVASGLLLVSSLSFALDSTLKDNMSQMENALSNMQKGFLYNSVELIRDGAGELKKANMLFSDKKMTQKYLPANKQHMSNVAYNTSKKIDEATTKMLKHLDKKEYVNAHTAYSKILDACTACHKIVRSW